MISSSFMKEQTDMVEVIRRHGVSDGRVLDAMSRVPRHLFIPAALRDGSDPYGDHPCPIGHGQTISQPFIVAYMTEKVGVRPGEKVLEVGTGSGYQAAILAQLGARVFSVEVIPELFDHARAVLAEQGFTSVSMRLGDGRLGWPEEAPFDCIIATCAPADLPRALGRQLADGGRMIIPIGESSQRLVTIIRRGDRLEQNDDLPVRFVPMVESGVKQTAIRGQ